MKRNNLPLGPLIEHAISQTTDPLVRDWLAALLEHGEHASGSGRPFEPKPVAKRQKQRKAACLTGGASTAR